MALNTNQPNIVNCRLLEALLRTGTSPVPSHPPHLDLLTLLSPHSASLIRRAEGQRPSISGLFLWPSSCWPPSPGWKKNVQLYSLFLPLSPLCSPPSFSALLSSLSSLSSPLLHFEELKANRRRPLLALLMVVVDWWSKGKQVSFIHYLLLLTLDPPLDLLLEALLMQAHQLQSLSTSNLLVKVPLRWAPCSKEMEIPLIDLL